jgi:hypothetical protein
MEKLQLPKYNRVEGIVETSNRAMQVLPQSIHPSILSKTVERSGKRKAGTKDLGEFMKNVSMASQFLSDRGS